MGHAMAAAVHGAHVIACPCWPACALSVLGYVTVCLVLLIIKSFGATSAEIVKSMRKVGAMM